MRASCAAGLAVSMLLSGAAQADEGLWTFDNFPAAKVKAAYGVDITPAWLDRVRGAAVRLSIGCSASVVSGAGLLLTNDHCVADCAQAISPKKTDYAKAGFLAATKRDEVTCPGMRADVLLQVIDVTPRMLAAGSGLTGEALMQARNGLGGTIEQEICGADRKLHCEVVNLYHGGQYKLYKYREYTDVRLVFSPGDRAAFFGGDPDNFNFPRYDLDCAFLRLYGDGQPVASPAHLDWNPAPPSEGEPVFVAGDPGGTFREQTVAELEGQRDLSLPLGMAQLSELRGRMTRFGEESPANARAIDEPLMDLENDYKVTVGRLATLDDPNFMAAKRAAEADLRARAAAILGPSLGDPWADMAAAQKAAATLYVPYRQLERGERRRSCFSTPATSYARLRTAGCRRAGACRDIPTASSRASSNRCWTPRRSGWGWSSCCWSSGSPSRANCSPPTIPAHGCCSGPTIPRRCRRSW
jgi:Peptidase S46